MADPDDLVALIKVKLPNLDPLLVNFLVGDRGQAFEAWCFTILGQQLAAARGWSWKHPPGGLARFSKGRGSDLRSSRDLLSHITNQPQVAAHRGLYQSVKVEGRSKSVHALDLVMTNLNDCLDPLPYRHVGAAIEVKNHGENVGPGVARELVGLQADLVMWCDCPPGRKRLATEWLVSASPVTTNATGLLHFYGIDVIADFSTGIEGPLTGLAKSLRFYRSGCPHC